MERFDDWLNPVLVKEIRQQLRSHTFFYTFFLFQIVYVCVAIDGLRGQDKSVLTLEYWSVLIVWMYIVMPVWAFQVVAVEKWQNTIDVLLVTPLSPKRIIWGKWWALNLQTIIVVSSVLPYFLVRYLLGREEILWDLVVLPMVFFGSLPFISLTIALASNRRNIIEFPFLLLFGMGTLFGIIFFSVVCCGVFPFAIIGNSVGMSMIIMSGALNQDGSLFKTARKKWIIALSVSEAEALLEVNSKTPIVEIEDSHKAKAAKLDSQLLLYPANISAPLWQKERQKIEIAWDILRYNRNAPKKPPI